MVVESKWRGQCEDSWEGEESQELAALWNSPKQRTQAPDHHLLRVSPLRSGKPPAPLGFPPLRLLHQLT